MPLNFLGWNLATFGTFSFRKVFIEIGFMKWELHLNRRIKGELLPAQFFEYLCEFYVNPVYRQVISSVGSLLCE